MPVLHGFGLVVQFVLAAHATHIPEALQTMSAPQPDPAGLLAASAQVCAPVAHDVVPALHGLGLVAHDWPAAHAKQAPFPSQTWPTPQAVPGLRLIPSPQLVTLPPQLVVPCLQAVGLPVQLWPATHAPQKPLPSHSWPFVHVAVASFGAPSIQTEAPVVQAVTPLRQTDGLAVHAVPAVHDTQTPLPLQTRLVPQVIPAAVLPVSRQRSAPVVQSMTPVLQGAPGLVVHDLPAWHITHCPLPLQTMLEPQAVPASTLSPSTQPEADPQVMTPSLHAPPGLLVQTVPAAQVVHAPALQTFSVPQKAPSGPFMPSLHWGAPVSHAIAPFLHGLPGFVGHDAFVAHGMHVPAALHTWSVPHVAPGVFAAPFMQPTGSQTTTPLRH